MRNFKVLLSDLMRKPPMLFPLVGLFHILWLLYTLWDDRHEPFPDVAWLQVLWMTGYVTFWLAACDLRKWGAMGYILLTLVDSSLYVGAMYHKVPPVYISNLCLIDGLFSFFLLFYYKRFN